MEPVNGSHARSFWQPKRVQVASKQDRSAAAEEEIRRLQALLAPKEP